jgi:serine/threonine-protein kinase
VHDVGELGSKAYIVMEYVEGVTLWQARESDQPPDRDKILDILRQTAAALDYAHERGIVHRDVKPGNIMIDSRGAVKIAHFGIAGMLSGERLTRTGMIVGTPHYMAPEQLLGAGEADPAADQFGLAINAYETLTGHKPFDADNVSALLPRDRPLP